MYHMLSYITYYLCMTNFDNACELRLLRGATWIQLGSLQECMAWGEIT